MALSVSGCSSSKRGFNEVRIVLLKADYADVVFRSLQVNPRSPASRRVFGCERTSSDLQRIMGRNDVELKNPRGGKFKATGGK